MSSSVDLLLQWIDKKFDTSKLIRRKVTVHREGKDFERWQWVKPEETPKFELKEEDVKQFGDIVKHINVQGDTNLDLNKVYENKIRPLYNKILGNVETKKLEMATESIKGGSFRETSIIIAAYHSMSRKRDFISFLKKIYNIFSESITYISPREIEEAKKLYHFRRRVIDEVLKDQKFITLYRGCDGKTIKKGQYKLGDTVKVNSKIGFSRMTLSKEIANDFARIRDIGGYVIKVRVPINRIYYIDGMFGSAEYIYENEIIGDIDNLEAEIIGVGK